MHSRTKKTDHNDQISSSNSTFFKKEGEQKNDFFSKSNQEPFFNSSNLIQTKLTIGEPNDKYEQEADAMADHVINRSEMPGFFTVHPPEIQSKCASCEEEEEAQPKLEIQHQEEEEEELQMQHEDDEEELQMQHEEEEEEIQMKGNNIQKRAAPTDFETKLKSSSMGQAIPQNVRQEMEAGLGADLSGVRIHNDSNATNLSSEINAQAFTHGNDIYFNEGKYNTGSQAGKHLLAHELTHTVQQGKSKLKPKIQRNLLPDSALPTHTPFNQDQTAAFMQLVQAYLDSPSVETGRAAVSAIATALEQAGEVQYSRPELTNSSPQFNMLPSPTAGNFIGSGSTVAGFTFPINGRIKVEIYRRAFTGSDAANSLGFLTGVILHEYIHVLQNIAQLEGSDAQREFQAWLWQAEHLAELGIVTGTEAARQIASQLRNYFGQMPASERTRRSQRRFDRAIAALAAPQPQTTPDVSQQTEEEEEIIQPKLVYGSGYKGFKKGKKEIEKAKEGKWQPATRDFIANTNRAGGGSGAKNLAELLNIIKAQGKESITKLGIIGHSNSNYFGLSGDMDDDGDVTFTAYISADELDKNKEKITALRDRFAKDAKITLYSCNSGGVGSSLLKALSQAFGVCVEGFKDYVDWCINWNTSNNTIKTRGNVWYQAIDLNDPLAGLEGKPDCEDFKTSVDQLTADTKNCEGVPKPESKTETAPESNTRDNFRGNFNSVMKKNTWLKNDKIY